MQPFAHAVIETNRALERRVYEMMDERDEDDDGRRSDEPSRGDAIEVASTTANAPTDLI